MPIRKAHQWSGGDKALFNGDLVIISHVCYDGWVCITYPPTTLRSFHELKVMFDKRAACNTKDTYSFQRPQTIVHPTMLTQP